MHSEQGLGLGRTKAGEEDFFLKMVLGPIGFDVLVCPNADKVPKVANDFLLSEMGRTTESIGHVDFH